MHRRRWIIVIGAALLILLAAVGWRAYQALNPPKPLFFDSFGQQHDFAVLPSWGMNRPMSDRQGTFAYADYGHNMFAVVVTGQNITSHTNPASTPTQATVLRGSAHETVIHLAPDRLVLISPGDRVELPLPPDTARIWHEQLYVIDDVAGADLLQEVLDRYQPANEQEQLEIERFCSSITE